MKIITLTSDMGLQDHYVASLKGAIFSLDQDVRVVDISHQVKPFDVVQAAFLVAQTYTNFPDGTIHIIAVDSEPDLRFGPGQEAVPAILKFNNQYFISNDNGFFGAFLEDKPHDGFYHLDDVLSNPKKLKFPSKDIFAPIALKIANGEKIDTLGTLKENYRRAFSLRPVIEQYLIKGNIVHFDNYGNAITNIDSELFSTIGKDAPFIIMFRNEEGYKIDAISNSYNDVPSGEKVAVFNSNGLLEIAINRGANQGAGGAEKLFGLRKNDVVRIEFQPRGSKETLNSLF